MSRLLAGDPPLSGTLGYTVDGVYTVSVPDNPAKYYVRFADGSFAQVYHRGRVGPVPDLPVEVGSDSAGNLVILGGDPQRAGLFAGTYEVGPHSHARGSGMEFPIDPRLLTPVKAAPMGGLSVGAAQGAYFSGGSLRWWGGGAVSVTPPAAAYTQAWVLIGIDPAAGSVVAVSGSAFSVTAPRDPSQIAAIDSTGIIPLAAVCVTNGQTELDEADFVDLRWPVGLRTSDYILIRDEKTSGTDGGTFTSGAWQTRDLNTSDPSGYVSSNQIALPAGTYRARITCPAADVDAHQARLQNVSDGATLLTGTSAYAAAGGAVVTESLIAGRFTLAAAKTLEVQHYCATTQATTGFGRALGVGTEVYTVAELVREEV